MKSFLIFICGFIIGIIVTFLFVNYYFVSNQPNDGLEGLTIFPDPDECITSTSKNKSCQINIFQVIAPNAALATIEYYTDERLYGGKTYRNHDSENDIVVLITNHEDKKYFDDQKIDISKKCARQIGTYRYKTHNDFEKTVPAVVVEE
jgi:hypothetical protein